MAAGGARAAGNRVRRIGLLMPGDENDPLRRTYIFAVTQALARNNIGLCFRSSLTLYTF
jgi:hypothetical protein